MGSSAPKNDFYVRVMALPAPKNDLDLVATVSCGFF
jgi:hypothetical protein